MTARLHGMFFYETTPYHLGPLSQRLLVLCDGMPFMERR